MIRIISQDGTGDINYANHTITLDFKKKGEQRREVIALPNYDANYSSIALGEYESEERAREVLKKLHDFASGRGMNAVVYFPMPEA